MGFCISDGRGDPEREISLGRKQGMDVLWLIREGAQNSQSGGVSMVGPELEGKDNR